MKAWKQILVTMLIGLSDTLLAGEAGTVIKSSELKAKPFNEASNISVLEASSSVEIISRQGAWMQVKASKGGSGWVRMFNIRTEAGKQASDGGMDKLGKMYKTGSSGSAVTTGVKGLSAEDLKLAQPNQAELQKMNNYRSNGSDARQFAQQGKLNPQHVEYLP